MPLKHRVNGGDLPLLLLLLVVVGSLMHVCWPLLTTRNMSGNRENVALVTSGNSGLSILVDRGSKKTARVSSQHAPHFGAMLLEDSLHRLAVWECFSIEKKRPWGMFIKTSPKVSNHPLRQLKCLLNYTGSGEGTLGRTGRYGSTQLIVLPQYLESSRTSRQARHLCFR